MKALVFNGPKQIRYESFDDPIIRSDQNMVIQVKACSICGSDLHMYHGDRLAMHDYSKPKQRFCTGHETIGEVQEVGTAVRRHKVGDQVMVAGGVGCGSCKRCLAGQVNACEAYANGGKHSTAYGISSDINGGHAEYLEVVNADQGAAGIPEGISDEQALLLTDALSTGYFGVKMARVKPGDTVAVIGQGPVGRMAAEAAAAIGAAQVFAIDPQEARLDFASSFGAIGLHPNQAKEHIYEATKGLGADSVIEAVGTGSTLSDSVKLARLGGKLSILGMLQADSLMPLHIAQGKSLNVHMGVASIIDFWPELIALVQAGKIKGDGVFTHSFSLCEGEEAYRKFDAREDGVIKVLMKP